MTNRVLLRALLLAAAGLVGCGGEKGVCVKDFGGVQGQACSESNAGECDSIGGVFHEGKTCKELGFPN